jgi:photosystem II stability/assembly factor-like uncharacterized protein
MPPGRDRTRLAARILEEIAMKRSLALCWGLVGLALPLPFVAAPAAAQEEAGDADVPPFADDVDREWYRRARADWLNEARGLPHFLPYEPRSRALAVLEEQERTMHRGTGASWVELGPAPIPNGQVSSGSSTVSGRVSSIAVHPTDPDEVYVGTAQGGVYRSLDGGLSWSRIFDNAESLAIGAVALAPSDPTILYVGTGEAAGSADSYFGVGLYRIDDPATTATLTGPINPAVTTGVPGTTAFTGRSISEILVHPNDPATIFVSTYTGVAGNPQGGSLGFTVPPLAMLGVYRSTDATSPAPSFTKLTVATGVTVPPDTTGNIAISDIAMDPTDPNRLIAWANGISAANNGGLYLSTNALAANPTFAHVLVSATSSVRAELAGNRVGATVTFYAATGESNGRLRKSTDGGATWTPFLTGGVNFCNPQCFYDIALDVHPTNADILNLGGSPTLVQARSTDGGATFTTNAQTAVGLHVDTHAIAISRSNPSVVYFGSDGGIWRSADGGVTWTSRNNGDFAATQFQSLATHPVDRQFLIGGTQDNGTNFLRPDGTWIRADFGDGGYALIDQSSSSTTDVTMYHTYFNQTTAMGFARVTDVADAHDNGWQGYGCGFGGFIANGITCGASAILFYAPMALGPGVPNTVYFGSDRLYRSANEGVTMPPVSQVLESGRAITAIGISPADDDVRLVGLRNGKLFATTTGSATLDNVTHAGMPLPHPLDTSARRPVSRVVFHPTDPETVYVAFTGYGVASGQHVWKTTSLSTGAAGWVPAGAGIPDVPVNGLVVDPADPLTLYAGTDIGVYRSTDGGGSWLPFGTGLPRVAVFDMAFQGSTERVLRVATHGRGIWEHLVASDTMPFLDGFETGDTSRWSSTVP